MLKIVMEDMGPGEIAAMYEEDGDAVIMVARHLPDDLRCDAVNRLLARVSARISPYRFPRPLPSAQQEGTAPDERVSPTALRLAR